MIMKANKQIGFIYKDNESIDRILKDGDVVFERGFLREKTSTALPITFGGVGKDLKDYKIYGNTYQNSTSGKNLYGISDYSNTVNGVEITIKDGMITLNGTCTGGTTLYINPKYEQNLNGNYNMSLNLLSGTYTGTANINLRNANDDTVIDGTQLSFNVLNKGFTLQNKNIKYGIYFVKNAVFDNFKFRPQLVTGAEPDYNYEPYTGGQPSPNPDYPQEIISCGDRTKNLAYNFRNVWYSTNSNTFTDNNNFRSCMAKVNPNTTYTISKKNISNRFVIFASSVEINPTVPLGRQIRIAQNPDFTNYTFTTQNNENYIFFGYYSGTDEQEIISAEEKIMIEEGSTATSYEPYGYKIPVNLRSDNLFDISNVTSVDNGSISDSLITSNTITSGSVQNIRPRFSTPFPFKAETYYISADIRRKSGTGELNKINDGFTDYTKVIFPNLTNEFQKYVVSHQYNSDTSYSDGRLLFQVASNSNQLVLEIKNIMISTSNDYIYVPYYNETTNIYLDEPLRKTKDGTYVDYIDFINQKVYRQLGEAEISDYSNFGVNAITARFIQYLTVPITNLKLNIPDNDKNNILLLCNYISQFAGTTATSKIRINIPHEYLGTTSSSTATEVKQALINLMSGKTMEFVYPLETPTQEIITLPNIPTIDGNNKLNIETEITPSQVYIKYKSNE